MVRVLKQQDNWGELKFYQKTVVLYQLTYAFTKRFLAHAGDRTVDQMVQAARSGKQNIVEGLSDGVSSTEMELRLLNVARSSIQELREDYVDYLVSRQLPQWQRGHSRYEKMRAYCSANNTLDKYEPYFHKWADEEMANVAITLCHQVDSLMNSYQRMKEQDFVENGGIKERMTAVRLARRSDQRRH